MAIIYVDGFDHYATADYAEKATSSIGHANNVIQATNARTGSCLKAYNSTSARVSFPSRTTLYIGLAVRAPSGGAAQMRLFDLRDPATRCTQSWMKVENDGMVLVGRANSQFYDDDDFCGATWIELGRSGAGKFRYGSAWNYFEVKFVLHATAGEFSVKLNGEQIITVTGADTRNNSSVRYGTAISQMGFGFAVTPVGENYTYFDDLVVCDGSGSVNDTYPGEVRVATILPSTGNGSNTDWTCSTSTDHGALVDETTPNDDTDYVYSSTLNQVDTWNFPALSVTGTVRGVQLNLSAKKSDPGTRAIAGVTRPASTNRVDDENVYLNTSYGYARAIWDVNPEDSNAWDVSDIDGAEFGVKLTV